MHEAMDEGKLVRDMITARSAPAVQKLKLATIKSARPGIAIFAFEGVDDKRVFYHWIKQVAPNIVYEPFVCHGKGKVLELKSIVDRDLNGIQDGVYFFIDKDFDGLRGHAPSERVFMTDTYSFENYLVEGDVLDEILKIELHCHSEPECRSTVVALFEDLYAKFIQQTENLNFRIYLARRCSIEQTEHLPSRINQIATVTLSSVEASKTEVSRLVALEREPSAEDIERLSIDFKNLRPRQDYRGKFALLFFNRVLELLIADRNREDSVHFPRLEREALIARGPVTLDSLASKSRLPTGLHEFLAQVTVRNGLVSSPSVVA